MTDRKSKWEQIRWKLLMALVVISILAVAVLAFTYGYSLTNVRKGISQSERIKKYKKESIIRGIRSDFACRRGSRHCQQYQER